VAVANPFKFTQFATKVEMKIIIGISMCIDLEDLMRRLLASPAQRIRDILSFDFWIEKKR